MSKSYCYTLPNGRAGIIYLADGQDEAAGLLKTRFCLSIAAEMKLLPAASPQRRVLANTHFDPANPAHVARTNAFSQMFDLDPEDIPTDRSRRDDWALTTKSGMVNHRRVIINPTPLPPLPR